MDNIEGHGQSQSQECGHGHGHGQSDEGVHGQDGHLPVTLVCHLCARHFGYSSLRMHIPKCEKKWLEREALKLKKDQRLLPKRPSVDIPSEGLSMDMEAYNAEAYGIWKSQFVKCLYCERRFEIEALRNHMDVCPGTHLSRKVKSPPHPPSESGQSGDDEYPDGGEDEHETETAHHHLKMLVCHLCGREFSFRSLPMHFTRCEKKWLKKEALKPKKEQRPLPKQPSTEVPSAESTSEIEAYNKEAYAIRKNTLMQCPFCEKRFEYEAFKHHKNGCTAEHHTKNPGEAASSIQSGQSQDVRHKQYKAGNHESPEAEHFQAPKMLVCYVCGREFGTLSLPIHIPQCEKKWLDNEALKPKKEQRPPPKRPSKAVPSGGSISDVEAYNEEAYAIWKDSLVQCSFCQRRFKYEAFKHHQVGCSAQHTLKKPGESVPPTHPQDKTTASGQTGNHEHLEAEHVHRLKMLVCHVCGREFGISSLPIHIPQCEKKWLDNESLKPKKERRPLPKRPSKKVPSGESTSDIETYNEEAHVLRKESMLQCLFCGRRFEYEGFKRHQIGCTAEHPLKKVGDYVPPTHLPDQSEPPEAENFRRPKMLMCHVCGREFGTLSLPIHIPQCEQKWLDNEALKPKEEQRQLPKGPSKEVPSGESIADIEAYNEEVNAIWRASLVQCPFCARRFEYESFKHHQVGCTAEHPAKRVGGESVSPTLLQDKNVDHEQSKAGNDVHYYRPKMLVCFICGREFGTLSLPIHIPQCARKWLDYEALKPKKEQRPLPKEPSKPVPSGESTSDMEAYNEEAYAIWKGSLVQCLYCERRFEYESFKRHQVGCTAEHPAKRVGGESVSPTQSQDGKSTESSQSGGNDEEIEHFHRPRMLVCHVCGREYGISSLPIHIPQCEKKFLDNEALKPKKEQRPLPKCPSREVPSGESTSDIEAYNEEAYAIRKETMVQCPFCERRFEYEAFQRHKVGCTAEHPAKRVGGESGSPTHALNKDTISSQSGNHEPLDAQNFRQPKMLVCHVCGLQFGTLSLPIHIPQCRKKFLDNEALKPKEEQRPLPESPTKEIPNGESTSDMEAYNEEAYAIWKGSLVQCPFCERRFQYEAFKRHQIGCTAEHPMRKMGESVDSPNSQDKSAKSIETGNDKSPPPEAEHFHRPKMLVCYVCGHKFGTASLPIHIPQCEKKWLDIEALKPKKEQRPLPKQPSREVPSGESTSEIEAYNEEAYAIWKESMVQCPYCERRFEYESFKHHQVGCTAEHPAKRVGGESTSLTHPHDESAISSQNVHHGPNKAGNPEHLETDHFHGPTMLVCCVCGQEFGTLSLRIHIPQCETKWLGNEALKPKKDQRPLPKRPSMEIPSSKSTSDIEAYNKEATAAWKESLMKCPFCERRFEYEAFKHHQVGCTEEHPLTKV